MEKEHLTLKEATDFFAEFYRGAHHIPAYKPKPFGYGFCVNHDRGDLASFDFCQLTMLVVMAHDKCIRVSVDAARNGIIKIAIWKRKREGSMSERHPTLEDAVKTIREFNNNGK